MYAPFTVTNENQRIDRSKKKAGEIKFQGHYFKKLYRSNLFAVHSGRRAGHRLVEPETIKNIGHIKTFLNISRVNYRFKRNQRPFISDNSLLKPKIPENFNCHSQDYARSKREVYGDTLLVVADNFSGTVCSTESFQIRELFGNGCSSFASSFAQVEYVRGATGKSFHRYPLPLSTPFRRCFFPVSLPSLDAC